MRDDAELLAYDQVRLQAKDQNKEATKPIRYLRSKMNGKEADAEAEARARLLALMDNDATEEELEERERLRAKLEETEESKATKSHAAFLTTRARLLYDDFKFQGAVAFLEEALEFFEQIYGLNDPETIKILLLIGCSHQKLGDFPKSSVIFEDCIHRSSFGLETKAVPSGRFVISKKTPSYKVREDYYGSEKDIEEEEAKEAARIRIAQQIAEDKAVLKELTEKDGISHILIATADSLYDQGKHQQSWDMYEEILDIKHMLKYGDFKSLLVDTAAIVDEASIIEVQSRLSRNAVALGLLTEAASLSLEAYMTVLKSFPAQSMEVAAAMYTRGLVLTNLGDVRGAVEMLREVLYQCFL